MESAALHGRLIRMFSATECCAQAPSTKTVTGRVDVVDGCGDDRCE